MKAADAPLFLAGIRRLVGILAQRDAAALDQSGFPGADTAQAYLTALDAYLCGRSLTPIPDTVLDNVALYRTGQEERCRADVDLWVDGARSDLTAVVYFDDNPASLHPVRLHDLRVL